MSPEYCQQTVRSRLDVRAAASLLRPTRHRDFLNSLRSRWSLPPADSGEKVQNDSDLLSPKKYVRFYLMIWVLILIIWKTFLQATRHAEDLSLSNSQHFLQQHGGKRIWLTADSPETEQIWIKLEKKTIIYLID